MDEKLSKALQFANFTRTFEDQKTILKETYFDSLIYYTNGGQFTVNKSLLTFVNLLLEKQDSAVIVDDNDNPFQIDNLQEFYDNILDLYFQSSNEYYEKVRDLKTKRSVGKLVGHE